jgi:2'-5' RNA ligase
MGRQTVRPENIKTDYERAFIALVPDAATVAQLSAHRVASYQLSADQATGVIRPYEPEDLHMTLAFLGGINTSHKSAILAQLPDLAKPLPTLTCIGEAWWPTPSKPRVHVIRYGQPQALKALYEAVQTLVKRLSLPVDSRPFRPHITLARISVAKDSDPHQQRSGLIATRTALNARMQYIGLFCQNKEGGRLRYRVLGQFELC